MPAAAPPGIGVRLRKAREDRRLSIEETAWRTRIRPDLLRALEREQFGAMEHAGFARSLLSSYARFLGLEPREIVDDFVRRYGRIPSPVEELERRGRREERPKRPKWPVAAVISALLLIAAGIFGLVGGEDEQLTGSTGLRPSDPATTAAGPAASRVTLVVSAIEDSPVTVVADGRVAFDGTLLAGQTRTFTAGRDVDVTVMRAGAIDLRVNGTSYGRPGRKGETYRARFGPDGPLD